MAGLRTLSPSKTLRPAKHFISRGNSIHSYFSQTKGGRAMKTLKPSDFNRCGNLSDDESNKRKKHKSKSTTICIDIESSSEEEIVALHSMKNDNRRNCNTSSYSAFDTALASVKIEELDDIISVTNDDVKTKGLGTILSPVEIDDENESSSNCCDVDDVVVLASDEIRDNIKKDFNLNMNLSSVKTTAASDIELLAVSDISNDGSFVDRRSKRQHNGSVKYDLYRRSMPESSFPRSKQLPSSPTRKMKPVEVFNTNSPNSHPKSLIKGSMNNDIDVDLSIPMKKETAKTNSLHDFENDEIEVNSIVEVQRRMWSGINKPGGTARVKKCHYYGREDSKRLTHVDVRYIVMGGSEKKVSIKYCKLSTDKDTKTKPKQVNSPTLKARYDSIIVSPSNPGSPFSKKNATVRSIISPKTNKYSLNKKELSTTQPTLSNLSSISLGLVRVLKAENTLSEICSSLSILSPENSNSTVFKPDVYPIFPNAILGRDNLINALHKNQSSVGIGNKVNLHIPHTVKGVSRNLLQVLDIIPSTIVNSDQNLVDLPQDATSAELLYYLEEFQQSMPTVKVQVSPIASYGVNVIKVRIPSKNSCRQSKRNRDGSVLNFAKSDISVSSNQTSYTQDVNDDAHTNIPFRKKIDYIRPKNMVILKMGDCIEFDAYDCNQNISDKSIFSRSVNMSRKTNGNVSKALTNEQSRRGKHVFRLVALCINDKESQLNDKSNINKQDVAKCDVSQLENPSLQKVEVKSSKARLVKNIRGNIVTPSIIKGVIDKKNMRKPDVAKCDQSEVESTSLQKVGVKSSKARLATKVEAIIVVPSIVKCVNNMNNVSSRPDVAKRDQSEVERTSLQRVGVKSITARLVKNVTSKIGVPSIAEGVIDNKNMRKQSVAKCDQSEVESTSLQKVGVNSRKIVVPSIVKGVIDKKNMRKPCVAKCDQSEVESTSLQKVGVKSSTARLLKDVKAKIVVPSITTMKPRVAKRDQSEVESISLQKVEVKSSTASTARLVKDVKAKIVIPSIAKGNNITTNISHDLQNKLNGHTLPKTRKIKYSPNINDRFRVLYKQTDNFGNTYDIWYFGTVAQVKNVKGVSDKCIIKIKYDDNSVAEEDFPSKDMQMIFPCSKCPSLIYAKKQNCDDLFFAYDSNPSNLVVGDLVQCRFQNGIREGAWFHGRVAFLSKDGRNVDISYFDGGYEENIPLQQGNIYLIERGSNRCENSWVLGNQFNEKVGESPSKGDRRGTVVKVMRSSNKVLLITPEMDQSGSTTCLVQFCNGVIVEESFIDVVSKMFDSVRRHCSKKGKVVCCPSSNEALKKPNNDIKKSATTIIKKLLDVKYSSQEFTVKSPFKERQSYYDRNMNPSLANSLWRALNSSEPQNGFGLLMYEATVLNVMPNSQLAKSLIEFVVKGPKSEGTLIRDPNRTDLVLTYLDFLIDKSYRNGYSSCPLILKRSEFEFILSLPITETTDFTRYKTNNMPMSMVWRLSQAMQMSSRSLLFLSKLVENQLSTIMESENSNTLEANSFAMVFQTKNLRDSLKSCTIWTMKCLLRHGHWLYGHLGEGKRNCESSDQQRCALEAKSCFKSLGSILCCISWMYCMEEKITFGHKDCCFVIRDCLSSVLESHEFVDSGMSGKSIKEAVKQRYKRGIFLRFLISLETTFSKPLQNNLGELLQLSSELSIIRGV